MINITIHDIEFRDFLKYCKAASCVRCFGDFASATIESSDKFEIRFYTDIKDSYVEEIRKVCVDNNVDFSLI